MFIVSRPVQIGIMVMFIHDCCGIFCMISYTAKIFSLSGAKTDPNKAAMIVAAIQLVATYISTMVVDRAGRRVCTDSKFP